MVTKGESKPTYRRLTQTPFEVPVSIETAYRTELFKLVTSWFPVNLKDISPTSWLNEVSNISSQKRIVESSTKLAMKMVTKVNVTNLKSWRAAALKAQGGPMIYHLLQEELRGPNGNNLRDFIRGSSSHITSIPRDVANEVLSEIGEAQRAGAVSSTVRDLLRQRFPEVLKSKIATLARTGCSSAATNLTRARCNELGITCFVWESVHDVRVRPSHRHMNGVVVFWDELPSPEKLFGQKGYLGAYAPGDCPNCRCFPRPILTVQDVFSSGKDRARVFVDGNIIMMSQSQFYKKTGIESRLAA